VISFFYVSWWTAVLFAGAVGLLLAAFLFREVPGRRTLVLAAGGVLFLGGYLAAVFVGPGRLMSVHGDVVLDAHVIELHGIQYTAGSEGCEERQDLEREGLVLRTIGHLEGLFGGPQVVTATSSRFPDSVPSVFLRFSDDCYIEWYPYGQI
jgi:hypothetical protein